MRRWEGGTGVDGGGGSGGGSGFGDGEGVDHFAIGRVVTVSAILVVIIAIVIIVIFVVEYFWMVARSTGSACGDETVPIAGQQFLDVGGVVLGEWGDYTA